MPKLPQISLQRLPRGWNRYLTTSLLIVFSGLCIVFLMTPVTVVFFATLLVVTCLWLLRQNRQLGKASREAQTISATLDAVVDIYWHWELTTGTFKYNGRLSELLGYQDSEPTDAFWKEIIHPIDRPLQKYQMLRHLEDETIPYYCEYRLRDNHGEYQWFAGRGKVVSRDESQKPLLMVGSLEHIQPRKDLEQSLIHAHKMEALGQLTGGIAHDFNNILGSVMGYTELAMDTQNPVKIHEYLTQVHQAGNRARSVVKQLLDFSRSSRDEIQSVDLKQEIEDSILMVRSTMPSTVEIEQEFPPGDCFARLDPNQLQRVLINLCINARDAMHGKGRLGVRLATETLDAGECDSCHASITGPHHVLSVSDTGEGLMPGTRKKLFEPFFTTKPFGEGTGMGLSVVHGIVHECSGHLKLISEPVGLKFQVYFPVQCDTAQARRVDTGFDDLQQSAAGG